MSFRVDVAVETAIRAGEGGLVAATSDSVILGRSGPYILEGHGWAEAGHATLPEGTWMWVPDEVALFEDVAREVARREMFAPGTARLYVPGQRVPNLVLAPGGSGMRIRPTSTIVTAPTAIGDILVPNMGVCLWVACKTPI